ncbi:MAG: 50S ribosome-binding GTPase [Thermoleophilia bacterium]|nr:50S ribosome-binding GTPase [Thermoleophilia bacterium]
MSANLDRRLEALAQALDLAEGRLDPALVDAGRQVVDRAGVRLGFGVESTVVALAGPTGAGKSSLFNELVRAELVDVSRRRPTTAQPSAAVWGVAEPALLDWLGVRRRHRVEGNGSAGLVLLDLPDFDSVEVEHRLEVDRLIELVDQIVWVVDPQKYADAVWHEQYLRPLAAYEEAMAFVLNQIDLLAADALEACTADLRRLLREDGLGHARVFAVSARTGAGVDGLRRLLADKVTARAAAASRLATDVEVAAGRLAPHCGTGPRRGVAAADRKALAAALTAASGAPAVVRAVEAAHRRRGALATGWPPARWLRRLRPDPLARLGIGDRSDGRRRTSLPGATAVQRAQADTAARKAAAHATDGLPEPWPALARSAATRAEDAVADRLDRAIGTANLHVRPPRWWRLAGLLQLVLAAAALVGALWLLALALLGFVQLDDAVPLPEVAGLPLPTLLLAAGALSGILVGFLAGALNASGARRRARAAQRSLEERVARVAEELVLAPIEAELGAHDELRSALDAARSPGPRGLWPLGRRGGAPTEEPAGAPSRSVD